MQGTREATKTTREESAQDSIGSMSIEGTHFNQVSWVTHYISLLQKEVRMGQCQPCSGRQHGIHTSHQASGLLPCSLDLVQSHLQLKNHSFFVNNYSYLIYNNPGDCRLVILCQCSHYPCIQWNFRPLLY